eukprot:TRINITY_DN22793_c0_g1_i4.p1 TRINITY_DN22793_c0_g1~~TRINITY_DN22793_c0_g1_i4.p1  ORF type:complete len:1300 (-),score=244.50 TRINITY_DN22793_c0_g1_i4:264-3674(-)
MKPGDWICPACDDLQFARNANCRRCGEPAPDAEPMPPMSRNGAFSGGGEREGDWICPSCGDMQFARNSNCRRCHEPKPGSSGRAVGSSAGFPPQGTREGDWMCPGCGEHVFARNANCRRCGCAKPQPSGQQIKDGDWNCPECGDHVFGRNASCRKCGCPRPGVEEFAFNGGRQAIPSRERSRDFRDRPVSGGRAAPQATNGLAAEPGDWECPNCGDVQFRRNHTCRLCGTPKGGGRPAAEEPRGGSRQMVREGDWHCPNCSDLQFARNEACRKCGTPKPAGGRGGSFHAPVSGRLGGGGGAMQESPVAQGLADAAGGRVLSAPLSARTALDSPTTKPALAETIPEGTEADEALPETSPQQSPSASPRASPRCSSAAVAEPESPRRVRAPNAVAAVDLGRAFRRAGTWHQGSHLEAPSVIINPPCLSSSSQASSLDWQLQREGVSPERSRRHTAAAGYPTGTHEQQHVRQASKGSTTSSAAGAVAAVAGAAMFSAAASASMDDREQKPISRTTSGPATLQVPPQANPRLDGGLCSEASTCASSSIPGLRLRRFSGDEDVMFPLVTISASTCRSEGHGRNQMHKLISGQSDVSGMVSVNTLRSESSMRQAAAPSTDLLCAEPQPMTEEVSAASLELPPHLRNRTEVCEVAVAMRGQSVHVLYAGSGAPDDPCCVVISTTDDRDCDPLDVPDDAEAVLLLSDVTAPKAARLLIRDLHDQSQPPPVIVILLRRPGHIETKAAVCRAQKAFRTIAADDVLLQPSRLEELPVQVFMSLNRVEDLHATVNKYEERIKELQEQEGWMFWRCVHRILSGFPRMLANLSAVPKNGVQVAAHKIGSCIGRGGFGRVWSSVNAETGEREAVKVVAKKSITEMRHLVHFWNEFLLLQRMKHPNVVAGRDLIHARSHLLLIMDFAGSQDLCRAIMAEGGKLSVERARQLQRQIAGAVSYLHDQLIAHRDLKHENIVVSEDGSIAKLVDFGLAQRVEGKPINDRTGTMPFMAPEVLRGELPGYDMLPVDVWAMGVMFMEMLVGVGSFARMLDWKLPPSNKEQRQQDVMRAAELVAFFQDPSSLGPRLNEFLQAQGRKSVSSPSTGGAAASSFKYAVPESFLSLLRSTLHVKPAERMSALEVVNCPWLADSV